MGVELGLVWVGRNLIVMERVYFDPKKGQNKPVQFFYYLSRLKIPILRSLFYMGMLS